MNINRIQTDFPHHPSESVTIKRCGNILEIRRMIFPAEPVIEKINADFYVDKRTGEIKEFHHTENRAEGKARVSQSLRKLRDLINANLENPETALWVTMTYRKNMRDTQQLYEDFRRF